MSPLRLNSIFRFFFWFCLLAFPANGRYLPSVIHAQNVGTKVVKANQTDRGCTNVDPLEHIERRAQVVSQGGADHIAVGKDGHGLPRMSNPDLLKRGDDPILHFP